MPPSYKLKPQDFVLNFLKQGTNAKDFMFVTETKNFYRYTGGYYQSLTPEEIQTEFYNYMLKENSEYRLSMGMIDDLVRQLAIQTPIKVHHITDNYIAFNDVLLDLSDFTIHDFDRKKQTSFYLPFSYASITASQTPYWTQYLKSTFVIPDTEQTDGTLIDFVQEMLGNILLPSLKSASSYFLVGDGANGKSILLDVIRKIVGDQYLSSSSIETLTTDKFSVASLVGKKINICNEEESKFVKADKFKALVTGDPVDAQYKFGAHFTFRPRVKYLFASNEMPTFNSVNEGTLRRLKIIPFNAYFGPNDPKTIWDLDDRLEKELPGIIAWAIEGAKRLISQKLQHSTPPQIAEALEGFKDEASSAVAFFREKYIVTNGGFTSNDILYDNYKQWCIDNGKKQMSKAKFGRDLQLAFKNLRQKMGRVDSMLTHGRNCEPRNLSAELEGVEGASTGGISVDEIDFGS
jgi:putative DNA primase/helicase